jgi:dTDP-glucose 4,6-dehydratase
VSTDEVFGALPLDRPELRFDRTSAYAPRSPYAASKAAADHLVRAYHHTYGLPVILTNCGNNYGPYQHPEKLIPRAITRLMRGERVPVFGDGRAVRDWIYVEDHCRALELVARQGIPGETYLVGASQERSNLDLVRALLAAFGRTEDAIEFLPDRPGHDLRYALDASFLRQSLGWSPRVSFEEGLARTVAWYREKPEWWEPLLAEAAMPAWSRRTTGRAGGAAL